MRPETTEALRAWRELFNQGRHFDAHETWEVAWRKEEGEVRVLLQALILVAAGCHKATKNEPRGAVKLLGSALEKLAPFSELDEFRRSVAQALAEAERWLSGEGAALSPSFQLDQRF